MDAPGRRVREGSNFRTRRLVVNIVVVWLRDNGMAMGEWGDGRGGRGANPPPWLARSLSLTYFSRLRLLRLPRLPKPPLANHHTDTNTAVLHHSLARLVCPKPSVVQTPVVAFVAPLWP